MELPQRKLEAALLLPEIEFITSRSGGPGGQNVNKVNSKVTLRFDVRASKILTEEEKQFVAFKLAHLITQEGHIQLTAQESRSQSENKETVIAKLDAALSKAYHVKKPRKKSKPGKAAVQKRLDEKKKRGEKKQNRRFKF